MKRYNCTSSDKRGAFGLCMEEHSDGMFVPFTEVGPLNRRINQLLEERNRTGIAISNAILSGVVPDKHPLLSRLELLANHHKREQELTAKLEDATRKIGVLAGLLREVMVRDDFDRDDGDSAGRLLYRIDAVLAGKLPDHIADVSNMVTEGWQLVPRIPTPEMRAAYHKADSDWEDGWAWDDNGNRHESPVYQWIAMLDAAPKPQGGAPSVMQWLPIETAPLDGRKAIVFRPLAENSGDEPIAVKRLIGGTKNACWARTVPAGSAPTNPTDGSCHVTHWMPLPAWPNSQGGAPCDTGLPSSKSD